MCDPPINLNRVKGMGLYTSEEIIGNMTGKRWTVGPGKFQIQVLYNNLQTKTLYQIITIW